MVPNWYFKGEKRGLETLILPRDVPNVVLVLVFCILGGSKPYQMLKSCILGG